MNQEAPSGSLKKSGAIEYKHVDKDYLAFKEIEKKQINENLPAFILFAFLQNKNIYFSKTFLLPSLPAWTKLNCQRQLRPQQLGEDTSRIYIRKFTN